MTKRQLIDLLKHRLAGGDCPQELKGKYHPEILAKHISLAHNYLLKTVAYREAEQTGDFGLLDAYTKTYIIDVLFDDLRKEYYSLIPIKIVDLPENRGIRFLSDVENQSIQYIYRSNNSEDIYNNLDVSKVSKRTRYYRERDKVYYRGVIIEMKEQVLAKLIPDFDSLEDEDDVSIPSAYGKLIFDLVFQSMSGMPMEKVSNDNNANVP